MRIFAFFWILLLWDRAFGSYQKVTEKVFFNGDKLLEFKLPNSLQVLLVSRHQAQVLTFQTWFRVGSIHEKLDPKLKKTGLAHLFEHMMFRGTEKYPDGKFDQITAEIGGDKQNATTYFYRTNYFESIPSSQLERLMEIESDRMKNLKLTKEIFEKEKGAVVGELRRHNDSPSSIAYDELMLKAFAQLPYRWTVLGSEEEIKGFTLEEAQYFYKTFYAPNDCTLIVVGDVTEKTLLPLIEKYYGDMKSATLPVVALPTEPVQKEERKKERAHSQATSEILLVGYHIPGIESQDIVPLSLLGSHLSTGTEASLRKLLVDTGIAVSVRASPGSQPDLFQFFVQMAEGQESQKALQILDSEIKRLQARPIRKDQFERALNQDRLSMYSDIQDNAELADFLGEYLVLSGNYMRGFEILEAYSKIAVSDLQRVAKQYLRRDSRTVVMIRPEKKKGAAG